MSDTDTTEIIAVVGETVPLAFDGAERFAGPVDILFSISALDGPPGDADRKPVLQIRFKRTLPVEPPAASDPPTRSRVRWPVEVTTLPDLPHRLCLVTFEASGTGVSGRPLRARSSNRLRVPGIALPDRPELKAIMLHEFSAQGQDGSFVLDTAALEQRLAQLTVEQRKLLATYDVGGRAGRIVVFVTFDPAKERPMFADNCSQPPMSMRANATFTAFACRGKGELVTLACHTDHFVVNTVNGDTRNLFLRPQKRNKPDQWLSPRNPTPPRFVCGSFVAGFTDGVIWSRIFTDGGVDVMPGNTVHGILNTKGCWMLFRNYNWPLTVRDRFFHLYTHIVRTTKPNKKELRRQLAAAGYDVQSEPPQPTDSPPKFLLFDLNYAYIFFFRDVVGVKFFARTSTFYQRFENLKDTHGRVFAKTFSMSDLAPGEFLYHDIEKRKKEDRSFKATDALFTDNVLGFRTTDGFLPDSTWKRNLSAAVVKQRTWSDWYFFKPDGFTLKDALRQPVGPAP